MGQKRKCAYCGERAVAYRVEQTGDKTFLCYDHIPITAGLDSPQPARSEPALEMRARRALGLLLYYGSKK
jgi:hypothetical protein